MTKAMAVAKEMFKRLSILRNGAALIGLVHLAAGAIVAREGFLKLRELWHELQPYLPLSLPAELSEKMATSLPIVLKTFVVMIGSLSALLVGLLWVFSGLYDVLRRSEDLTSAPDFGQPELVAQSLAFGRPVYQRPGWLVSALARLWPGVHFVSPVSREIFRGVLRSLFKIALLWVLVALAAGLLSWIPDLLRKYAQVRIHYLVPSPMPLYVLLGFLALFTFMIGLSLVPLRRREFSRGYESVHIRGRGEAELFFAILEESCRLLNSPAATEKTAVRLAKSGDPRTKGALIESAAMALRVLAAPAAYICLPVALLMMTMGFSRLIHFARPAFPMNYAEFLSYHVLDYVLEVAFAVALIAAGAYILEWARRLFDIRVFKSALIFCQVQPASGIDPATPAPQDGPIAAASSASDNWRVAKELGEEFALWARAPQTVREFRMELFWADVISQSASGTEQRFATDIQISQDLDSAVRHIIELPFRAGFQTVSGQTDANSNK